MTKPAFYILGQAPAVHVDPNALSRKELAVKLTADAVNEYRLNVRGDQLFLAEVVAGGMTNHRENFLRAFKGHIVDRNMADNLYLHFATFWRQQAATVYDPRGMSPEFFLAKVEIDRGPTDQEIEDDWVWESFSTENAMRHFYKHTGRRKTGKDVGRMIS